MSVTTLADQLGMHKGTCHSMLAAPTAAGLVSRDPRTTRYALGAGSMELGAAATARFGSAAPAIHRMHLLLARTGAGVMVVALVDDNFVNLASLFGAVEAEIGRVHPCAAPMGLVYKAFGRHREREAWLGGITSPPVAEYARAAMAVARRHGYVVGMAGAPYDRIGAFLDRISRSTDADERLQLSSQVFEVLRAGYYPTVARAAGGGENGAYFLTSPVRCPTGSCAVAITMLDVPRGLAAAESRRWARELVAAAHAASGLAHHP